MKLFEFDQHIGDWKVLVQNKDIQNGAIESHHISNEAVTSEKIGDGEVKGKNIAPEAVTTEKIGDGEVKGVNIAPEAVTTDKIADKSITGDNMAPGALPNGKLDDNAVSTRNIQDKNITEPKLGDESVPTRALQKESITPAKLSPSVTNEVILPIVNSIDDKYKTITDELYSMIASLQVGGIALSSQFGNREDIGITQKALTRMFGALWDTIESLHPGHAVFDFTLTVNPQYIFNEIVEDHISVKADCTGAVSDFDSVKVYVDDELKAESKGIRVYETSVIITKTSTIKVVGTILGKEIVKTAQVINEIPFFMGGGMEYTDIMNEECRKELVGSLEGEYDATISTTGQYLFVIIPISRKEEFRRCKMDMNGFEIPLGTTEMTDYIVSKSLNQYQAGTYNIDIDINS